MLFFFSANTKSSLSRTLFGHILVALVLLVKLSPAILDYVDIFVLQLEELNIPKVITHFQQKYSEFDLYVSSLYFGNGSGSEEAS